MQDGSGASIAWDDVDFAGNWLKLGEDGCLCFDYKVDWNENISTNPVKYPRIAIYTGASINNVNALNNNRVYATFIGHSTNPNIQDNVWNKWCLAIDTSSNNSLPSNSFGQWKVFKNGVLLSGPTAYTEFNSLIKSVTGLVLYTDYNGDPSEKVYFDNFCWTCIDTCQTSVLDISTGFNHMTGTTYSNLTGNNQDQDAFWTLTTAPSNVTVNLGGHPWVISNSTAWALPQTGSQWISAFNTAEIGRAHV